MVQKLYLNIRNKSLVILFVVVILLLITLSFVSAGVTSYNFSDYSTQEAFGFSANSGTITTTGTGQGALPPLFSGVFGSGTYNFTSAGYNALASVDTSYAVISSDGNNEEPLGAFNFTISESVGNIDWINVTMVQNQIAKTDTNCGFYIANFNTGLFETFATSMSGTTDVTGTINYTNPTEIGNILDSANRITLAVSATADVGEGCNVNYAEVIVGFSEAVTPDPYPQFTSLWTNVANASNYSYGQNYVFNSTVYDSNSTVWLEFNGANYSATNNTFDIYSVSFGSLAAGSYNYRWWAYGNGTSNHINNSDQFSYTVNTATPTGTITGTSPITYGTAGDVEGSETNNGDGDVIYILWRDDVAVSNPDTSVLSSGVYTYKYNTTGGANYSSVASLDTFELTVNAVGSQFGAYRSSFGGSGGSRVSLLGSSRWRIFS